MSNVTLPRPRRFVSTRPDQYACRECEAESEAERLLAFAGPAFLAGSSIDRVDLARTIESEHSAVASDNLCELAARWRVLPQHPRFVLLLGERPLVLPSGYAADQAHAHRDGGKTTLAETASQFL